MKKMILFALGLMVISLGSCKKEKNDEHITINVNTNVSDEKLDNKSGGVYFISTLVGEYIFRVNLKNGDNNMVCDMLHNEVYSKLPGQKTEWIPGEELNDYEFSAYGIKLILDIDELGTAQARVIVGEKEYETVVFKSTKEEPVKVYYGTRNSYENIDSDIFEYTKPAVFILKNTTYYYGEALSNDEFYIYGQVENITEDEITFKSNYSLNGGWDDSTVDIMTYEYDDNKIWFYQEVNNIEAGEHFIIDINLPLRFQD